MHPEPRVGQQALDDDAPFGDEQPCALERRRIADKTIFRRKRQ
jgi:hypothetical protein